MRNAQHKTFKSQHKLLLLVALLVIFCLSAVTTVFVADRIEHDRLMNSEDKDNLDQMQAIADAAGGEVTMSGTNSAMVNLWNSAISQALSDTSCAVLVKMNADWSVPSSATGAGFSHNRLYVPKNAHIILNLNGRTISRSLSTSSSNSTRQYGSVFYVMGTLTIVDTYHDMGIISGEL